jgi:ubiquinol-cytochrome c reductase cytochrome b subunit
MFSRILNWIDQRWPLSALLKLGLDEDIPGGTSYAYVFGSTTLFLFLLLVISGVWQLFYYVPTTDHAYNSLNYLRLSVPFGWLVHGIHHWGAQAMIVLIGLHMLRVFLWGAYKRPREMIWLAGTVLLLLTAGLVFTGALLPWDEQGYFAAEVGTSIIGTIPFVGQRLLQITRGGESMGQLTLSRFFVLHVAILPAVLVAFIGIHLVAFRRFGSVGPWKEEARHRSEPLWPNQVLKDALVGVVVLLVLIGLSAFLRAPFSGPADPADNSFQPKPEWNFLFLYQALKAFKGPWEVVGTIGVPLVIVLLFVLLPFLDRRPEHNPFRRWFSVSVGLIVTAGVIGLTVAGYYSQPGGAQGVAVKGPAESVQHMAPNGQEGAELFHKLGCMACHSVNGTGGKIGPDLSHEVSKGHSKAWIVTQIEDPKKHDPGTIMPAFKTLTGSQVGALAEYLLSLRSGAVPSSTGVAAGLAGETGKPSLSPSGPPRAAAFFIGNRKHGAVLFRSRCEACHGIDGTGKVPNPGSKSGTVPALNPISRDLYDAQASKFVDNIDRFIQYGAVPRGSAPALKMPDFGVSDTLTQQQISQIEAYILQLNGVDRAQLIHPGVEPRSFFSLAAAVFGLGGLGLGLVWLGKRKLR